MKVMLRENSPYRKGRPLPRIPARAGVLRVLWAHVGRGLAFRMARRKARQRPPQPPPERDAARPRVGANSLLFLTVIAAIGGLMRATTSNTIPSNSPFRYSPSNNVMPRTPADLGVPSAPVFKETNLEQRHSGKPLPSASASRLDHNR
ncbi:MAG: hypothetical protein U0271_22625 [Polyangiaceae bacterium]